MRRRVAAVVLAAGESRRMGAANKLLEKLDGEPVVARTVDALLASSARPLVVVTGHDAAALRAALAGRDLRFVHNADYGGGMSTSLRAGVAALEPKLEAALVCLGDMPWVRAAHVEALIEAFDPGAGRPICVPVHAGRRGHPVLFAARYFPELQQLTGDAGARELLDAHAREVNAVATDDPGVLRDVDSPEDLERARLP